MDTSETFSGKRERGPAEKVMGPEIPTQLSGKKCRVGGLRLAFVADKEVVKEQALWRHFEMRGKIDTQSGRNASAPFVVDGGGSVLSARGTGGRNRVSVQELAERELDTPVKMGIKTKDVADPSWAFFRKEVDGRQKAKARGGERLCGRRRVEGRRRVFRRRVAGGRRAAARGAWQDPDLEDGNVDLAGCVGGGSSHLRLIS